jgi:hypothetical protein
MVFYYKSIMEISISDFIAMVVISVIASLLSTSNIRANSFSDVRIYLNDAYMILLTTAWVVLFTFGYNYFSLNESDHIAKQNHITYILISIVLIVISIYSIRNQSFIDDKQFIKEMIPKHSAAIQMAQNIKEKSNNKQIKALADHIIKVQQAEIDEMKRIESEV